MRPQFLRYRDPPSHWVPRTPYRGRSNKNPRRAARCGRRSVFGDGRFPAHGRVTIGGWRTISRSSGRRVSDCGRRLGGSQSADIPLKALRESAQKFQPEVAAGRTDHETSGGQGNYIATGEKSSCIQARCFAFNQKSARGGAICVRIEDHQAALGSWQEVADRD